jgi:hypothetical protein
MVVALAKPHIGGKQAPEAHPGEEAVEQVDPAKVRQGLPSEGIA